MWEPDLAYAMQCQQSIAEKPDGSAKCCFELVSVSNDIDWFQSELKLDLKLTTLKLC